MADPENALRLHPHFGVVRLVTEEATRERWEAEIPVEANWREETVFQVLIQSSLADDPKSTAHAPPAFRAPNGTFVDLWKAFSA